MWLSAYKIERKDGHFRTAVLNDHNCAGHAFFLLTSAAPQYMYRLHVHSQLTKALFILV